MNLKLGWDCDSWLRRHHLINFSLCWKVFFISFALFCLGYFCIFSVLFFHLSAAKWNLRLGCVSPISIPIPIPIPTQEIQFSTALGSARVFKFTSNFDSDRMPNQLCLLIIITIIRYFFCVSISVCVADFFQASIFSSKDCQVLGTYYQLLLAFFSFPSFSPHIECWTFSLCSTKSLITQAHSYPRPWKWNESINRVQQIGDTRYKMLAARYICTQLV